MGIGLLTPHTARAQSSDEWQGSFVPLYLWASELSGDVTAGNATLPTFLDFGDAVDSLGGAFSFHLEARKGRLGLFSDLNFVRLSSESTFTSSALPGLTIDGDFDMDNTMFEIGGGYQVSETIPFAAIAGLRTYSLSPRLTFSTELLEATRIDASRTAGMGFVGFTYRPKLSETWTFVSRADIGGGSGATWSGMLGFEFRPRPWGSLILGYRALGIDVGSDDDQVIRRYDVTHYGPIAGLNFHWGGR
jgi:hypothetical protein